MNFKYTDLNKVKNFIAFDSGVICFYPAPEPTFNVDSGADFTRKIRYSDSAEANHLKNYGTPCPEYYDPRCRDWYVQQERKDYEHMTGLYRYSSGSMGLSACTPLWNSTHPTNNKYHGAYCMDIYTISEGGEFIEMYYKPKKGKIFDYLTLSEPPEWNETETVDQIKAMLQE
jgi:hypothetical protein